MTTFDMAPITVPAGVTWRALGTTVHLLVTDPTRLEVARRAVVAVLLDVDATYSRFRADSELQVLVTDAGREHLVSPLLARALGTALRAARATDGAVDPTIGRALRLLGYDDDFARLPRDAAASGGAASPVTFASVPGWRAIRFDPATRHVRIPAGVELDLGATGKGLAADLAAEAALDAMDGAGVLVSLGGDIATDGRPPAGGWRVLLADDHAHAPEGPGEVIRITDGAVATSSTTVRRWSRGGITRHHLLDPATGLPTAGPWRTATVVAATCADANAAATAAIVLGDRAPGWLARHGLPARLIAEDGSVLRVAGWPDPVPTAAAKPGPAANLRSAAKTRQAGKTLRAGPALLPAQGPALQEVTA
jgi:FAD:protein FMN transferase